MSTETLAEETANENTEAAFELGSYRSKPPTHLHYGYADWLKEKTGYGPDKSDTEAWEKFVKDIQLAVVLYGRYQKSDENEARKVREKEEREAAQEKAAAEREAAKAEKAKEREAAKEKAKADKEAAADGADDTKVQRKPGGKAAKPKVAASTVEAPF